MNYLVVIVQVKCSLYFCKRNQIELNMNQSIRSWLLLVILTYTAFIFNTTEFIPIGLLTDIAADFHISEAHAGLLISAYAWFVAIMSLPLMLAIGKYDFRKILLIIVGCFVLSHLLSAFASNFAILLVSRLGVACSHTVFWSVISPLAVHIAPEGKRETALGMIVTGTSLAMIAGLPLGRIIGLHLGWRASFGSIAIAALLAFTLLVWLFPAVPNKQKTSIKSLPVLLNCTVVRNIYIFTFLLVTAHYTGYSYIEPFLAQIAGMTDGMTTFSLTVFGIAGIAGSVLFSTLFDKHRKVFYIIIPAGIMSVLFLMLPASGNQYTVMAHCVCWGLIVTLFNLVMQSEIIRYVPQYATIAIAIFSSTFNVGIGCGALLGGAVMTSISLSSIGYVGGSIAVFALLFALKWLIPYMNYSLKN